MTEQAWWVQKWLELLDSYRFKKRLERARLYAREGNVLSIDFEDSQVIARVQGSEPEPYIVDLSLAAFSDEEWDYIIKLLSKKAIYSAQLLTGQMPDHIERVFIDSGVNLFPFSLADIRSRCTCPDQANPCKHIGAVYYQLGDRFIVDPFLLLQLRGRTKNQILEALREKRSYSSDNQPLAVSEPPAAVEKTAPDSAIDRFWQYDEELDPSLVVITPCSKASTLSSAEPLVESAGNENQTILDILGNFPLAAPESDAIEQFLKPIYRQIPQEVMAIALQ